MSSEGSKVARDRPIVLLAAGWRSGSTLVQRLLCSHPEVMVWGEGRGLVEHLREGLAAVDALQELSREQHEKLPGPPQDGWIPLLNPPVARFEEGLRALFRSYYAAPALAEGASRWGFKEVRCGARDAGFLWRLFPGARFLFLVRHPADCLASARGTMRKGRGILAQAGGPDAFLRHWRETAQSFLSLPGELAGLPHRVLVFEEIVEKPATCVRELADFLDLDPAGFDAGVFDTRLRGWPKPPRLERRDRFALRSRELWSVAARFGYGPRETLAVRHLFGRRSRSS